MTTRQYIILAILGTAIFMLSYAMSFLAMCLIFDDDVEEVPYDSEESCYEDTYYEWAYKHGYTIA